MGEISRQRKVRTRAAHERQNARTLRPDQREGIFRRNDRGVFRRERFLPFQSRRTAARRAGDCRVDGEDVGRGEVGGARSGVRWLATALWKAQLAARGGRLLRSTKSIPPHAASCVIPQSGGKPPHSRSFSVTTSRL